MPAKEGLPETQYLFVGNRRCLDFINTQMVIGGQAVDLLVNFESLVAWLWQSGALDERQAKGIFGNWQKSRQAETAFQGALALRACLREMVERLVKGKTVQQSVVNQVNEWLARQVGYAELKRTRNGFEKHFRAGFLEPAQLLWPIAESAADLLCYGDLALVKKCQNPACVLFFYDTSKNHSRRWCSMSVCGNRMKVAAHYQRLRVTR